MTQEILSIARDWAEQYPNAVFETRHDDGILRFRREYSDNDERQLCHFFEFGRIFDRGDAGVRSLRLTLVCVDGLRDAPLTAALVVHCDAEAERLAGCIANWACQTADDVVWRRVQGQSQHSTWNGRIPLDWSFDDDADGAWHARSPCGDHLLSILAGAARAPGIEDDDDVADQIIALVKFTTQRLHALDLEGDVEISKLGDDSTVVVHGRFFDDKNGRKLIRRWYAFTPLGDLVSSVQFNYVVPAARGHDTDVLAHAQFFADRLRYLDPEALPASPSI